VIVKRSLRRRADRAIIGAAGQFSVFRLLAMRYAPIGGAPRVDRALLSTVASRAGPAGKD
jgi:hypothetical protein